MITSTEIRKVLKLKGYKITKQAVKNWINRNRVEAIQIDNSLIYSLNDCMPFISNRVNITIGDVQELLKEIRTKLIN